MGAALFVIIVSYKILEPELFRTEHQSYVGNKEPFESHVEEERPDDVENQDHHRNAFPVEEDINEESDLKNGLRREPRVENASTDEVIVCGRKGVSQIAF